MKTVYIKQYKRMCKNMNMTIKYLSKLMHKIKKFLHTYLSLYGQNIKSEKKRNKIIKEMYFITTSIIWIRK